MSIEEMKGPTFWTDEAGIPLPDAVLKERSKTWTPKMWEEYLVSTEVGLSESLIDQKKYDSLNEKSSESIFVNAQSASGAVDYATIQNALAILTPRQRQVIELIFFKSLKQREVARILQISENRVRELKQIALKNVRQYFQRGPSHLPISRGNRNEVNDD